MASWTDDELDRIGHAEELTVAGIKDDGSYGKPVTIWAVRVDGSIYIRSVLGPEAGWFRGTRARGEGRIEAGGVEKLVSFTATADNAEQIDEAYRQKFGPGPNTDAIITELASGTTLRLDPK